MCEVEFWAYLRKSSFGKRVAGSVYLHRAALESKPRVLEFINARSKGADFNVVKLNMVKKRVSLLTYPRYFEDAFPCLSLSLTLSDGGKVTKRTYRLDRNPPILHRKELLIDEAHPMFDAFTETTRRAEGHSLFEKPSLIGRRNQWELLLAEKGVYVSGNDLLVCTD